MKSPQESHLSLNKSADNKENKLCEAIKDKECEVSRIEEQLDEARCKNVKLVNQLEKMEHENDRLEQEVTASRTSYQELKKKYEAIAEDNSLKGILLESCNNQLQSLSQKCDGQERDRHLQKNSYMKELEFLREELRISKLDKNQTLSIIAVSTQKNEKLRKEIAVQTQEIEALQFEVSALQERLATVQRKSELDLHNQEQKYQWQREALELEIAKLNHLDADQDIEVKSCQTSFVSIMLSLLTEEVTTAMI